MKRIMPQQCPVPFLYLNWLLYAGIGLVLLLRRQWPMAAVWLVAMPPLLYGYVRVFPKISGWLGYGSVLDEDASSPPVAATRVTMYTGTGCPFCPIVEQRLRGLQARMGFQLDVVEVTSRPELALRKRIMAVPMVEVGDRRGSGCMTTRELATLIGGDASPGVPATHAGNIGGDLRG